MARRRVIRRGSALNRKSADNRQTGSASARRPSSARRRRRRATPWLDISFALRVEMVGILFLALAVLTFLSFISSNQGKITGQWLSWLRQGFGWGAYFMPVALGAVGLGLLMHGFGRLPAVRWEKVLGLVLVFATALGLTHLFTASANPWDLVLEGRAGGVVGWTVGQGLAYAIGRIGAFVVVFAVLFTGVVLFVGRSTAEMGAVIWLAWDWLREQWQQWRQSRRERVRQESLPQPRYSVSERPEARPRQTTASVVRPVTEDARPPIRVIGREPGAAPASRPIVFSRPDSSAAKVSWRLPNAAQILEDLTEQEISQAEIQSQVQIIEQTLESFGVPARVIEVNQGPAITQFGVEPGFMTGRGGKQTKVKVSRISSLADDLALALAAAPIRIEAPVPGRSIVGIEVPNKEVAMVSLRGVMETEAFEEVHRKTPLPIALGENVSGEPIVANLISMPHLLIAGATGSGKSVCINAIVACLLCTNTPDALRMIMIDPKRVELTGYNGIPHLLFPVVVDLERVVSTLQWVTREMDQRYQRFAKAGARNIDEFNRRAVAGEQERMPFILVFIDELADLMMIAPDDVERSVCRIAQMARATGIHLVIATQRPSVDVVTGLIKANFPARISFMVTSSIDSRVIIDTVGAERLLGAGDMLFMAPDASQVMRLQGCFVSEPELERLIAYWKNAVQEKGGMPDLDAEFVQNSLPTFLEVEEPEEEALPGQADELLDKAVEIVSDEGKASTTLLQRRLRIGYARAARIIEAMEEQGLVGPDLGGSRGREVLISKDS